ESILSEIKISVNFILKFIGACRLMARLLHFRAARTISRNDFWMLVPQDLSHGTSFGFSCRKTCLIEPILDFRAARLVCWYLFWYLFCIIVSPDLAHSTSFGFSCRKICLLSPLLYFRAARLGSWNLFWIFVP